MKLPNQYKPKTPDLLHGTIYLLLSCGLAIYATAKHFIMIDEFVLLLLGIFVIVMLRKIDVKALNSTFHSPISKTFLLYLAYYILRFNISPSADLYIPSKRIALELAAMFSFYVVLILSSSLPRLAHVFFFFLWFLVLAFIFELLSFLVDFQPISNKNYYAYQLLTLVPFLQVALLHKARIFQIIIGVLTALTLFVFESRTVFLSLIIYYITFVLWPGIAVSRGRFFGLIILFIAVLSGFFYSYAYFLPNLEIGFLLNANEALTDKGLFGRVIVWRELLDQINSKLYLGHCSNCNTEFFMGSLTERNISSHNSFLEILFRGGIVGLAIFLFLLFRIANLCYMFKTSIYARICISYLVASIWTALTYEFIMFSMLSANFVFWLTIGLLWNGMRHDIKQAAK